MGSIIFWLNFVHRVAYCSPNYVTCHHGPLVHITHLVAKAKLLLFGGFVFRIHYIVTSMFSWQVHRSTAVGSVLTGDENLDKSMAFFYAGLGIGKHMRIVWANSAFFGHGCPFRLWVW